MDDKSFCCVCFMEEYLTYCKDCGRSLCLACYGIHEDTDNTELGH